MLRTQRRLRWAACLALLWVGCTSEGERPKEIVPNPESHDILGHYEDDYEIRYEITSATWTQFPSSVYHVVEWNDAEQYLIAQNDSLNSSGANLWTRIDWMTLEEMAPFEWAFCLTAYESLSAEEAKKAVSADRNTPMTGCAGHPFSRMKVSTASGMKAGADQGY